MCGGSCFLCLLCAGLDAPLYSLPLPPSPLCLYSQLESSCSSSFLAALVDCLGGARPVFCALSFKPSLAHRRPVHPSPSSPCLLPFTLQLESSCSSSMLEALLDCVGAHVQPVCGPHSLIAPPLQCLFACLPPFSWSQAAAAVCWRRSSIAWGRTSSLFVALIPSLPHLCNASLPASLLSAGVEPQQQYAGGARRLRGGARAVLQQCNGHHEEAAARSGGPAADGDRAEGAAGRADGKESVCREACWAPCVEV